MPLTWPVDKDSKDFVGQLDYLREYKEAFLQPGVVTKIIQFLYHLLSIHPMQVQFLFFLQKKIEN